MELHGPHAGRMLPRTYLPPRQPGTGKRSTVMVSTVTGSAQNPQGAVSPSPNVSSSHCLRTRRLAALPRALVFEVPRLVLPSALVDMPAGYPELGNSGNHPTNFLVSSTRRHE